MKKKIMVLTVAGALASPQQHKINMMHFVS